MSRSTPTTGLLLSLSALGLALAAEVSAERIVFTSEDAYRAELVARGYAEIYESFESEEDWGAVRTTISGGPRTAPSVTAQGITWTPNTPVAGVTTGQGPARSGEWGFYELPHGDPTNGVPDGFLGSSETPLYGFGGWIETNTFGATIDLLLDGTVAIGDEPLDYAHRFLGVVDTDGFHHFEVREIEATPEEWYYIFADDFRFGAEATSSSPEPLGPDPIARLTVAPNPCLGATEIHLELDRATSVRLDLCDPAGRRIRTLLAPALLPPGSHVMAWDGDGSSGQALPAGVYLAVVESPGARLAKRITVLR